jgi:hypothetical protein
MKAQLIFTILLLSFSINGHAESLPATDIEAIECGEQEWEFYNRVTGFQVRAKTEEEALKKAGAHIVRIVDGKTTRLGELGAKLTCAGCEYGEEGCQLSAKLKKDLAFKKVKDGLWEVKPKFRDSYTVTVILSCTPCTLISCILPEDSSDESTQCEESQTSQYNLQSTHSLYY